MTDTPHRVTLTFSSPDITIDLAIETERPVPLGEQCRITTGLLLDLCRTIGKDAVGAVTIRSRMEDDDDEAAS